MLLTYLIKVGSYYSVQYSLTVCSVHHNKGRHLWGEGGSMTKENINIEHRHPGNASVSTIYSTGRIDFPYYPYILKDLIGNDSPEVMCYDPWLPAQRSHGT